MHSGLIFPHQPRRLNLHVRFPKPDPPIRCGGSARTRPIYVAEVWGGGAEKSMERTKRLPVLKLTQVGEESILRRSRELRLRN